MSNLSSFPPQDEIMTFHPRLYMTDVMDHLNVANEDLTLAEHDLEATFQSYMTRISLDMTGANNEMAGQMNQLSFIATLMLPMTLVTGLFGMNCMVGRRSLMFIS